MSMGPVDNLLPDASAGALPVLDSIQQAAQAQFDRRSERYGRGHILADVSDVERLLERMRVHTGRAGPGRALDVATGGGHTGLYLAALGWQVTLTDIAASMLERVNAAARERGLSVETRQHAAEVLPYADATFELVTCRVAAHHFSNPMAFVNEAARVLVPGGALLVIDGSVEDGQPAAEAWLHEVELLRDPSHHRLWSIGLWKQMCADAGLHVAHARLEPMKQPDLNWYFETAGTSPANRLKVLELVRNAPVEARRLFRVGEEEGRIAWWWQRLELIALKSGDSTANRGEATANQRQSTRMGRANRE
jgi:SAM-dependent methyltransferase